MNRTIRNRILIATATLGTAATLFMSSLNQRASAEEAASTEKVEPPTECQNKLSLPILRPQSIYDFREYCGGHITPF
ncbi:MAG: hypothetical protein NTY08_00785 [Proteobacteria bacterium]|nr:hypothetical protein [Pseudomonadota bacterium]